MHEIVRLRPFREHLERERHLPMIEIAGRLERGRFVVSALGYEVAFDAVDAGNDHLGPYVLVSSAERALPNGFKLRVELEPDEELPPGGALHLVFEGALLEAARRRLRTQGADPSSAHLLVSPERRFSLYFNGVGRPNGQGGSHLLTGSRRDAHHCVQ